MTPHSDLFPIITFLAQNETPAQPPSSAPDIPGRDQPVTGSEGAVVTDATGSNSATLDPNNPSTSTNTPPPSLMNGPFIYLIFGVFAFMIITSIFGGKKQKKQREQMLGSLNKHDRIMTSSGMLGTIVEIKDKELVLRIDDATGTKAHFTRDAVAHVVKPHDDKPGSTD